MMNQVAFGEIESPKKQLNLGVSAEKITCNDGKVLMLKSSGMPACVKSTSVEKLEDIANQKKFTFLVKNQMADSYHQTLEVWRENFNKK